MARALVLAATLTSCARAEQVPLYKVAGAPIDQRVANLLSLMTIEEKVNQLFQVWFTVTYSSIIALYNQTSVGAAYAMYIPDNNDNRTQWQVANDLQNYMLNHSRLGIPVDLVQETLHSGMQNGTIFSMPCGMGSTWNPNLIHSVGRVIGLEARSGGATRAFSPELQVDTDPRFGRLQEGFGEDPKLVSDMGVAYALGVMNDNTGGPNTYLDAVSPVPEAKHFAAYGYAGKDGYRADISNMTLFNIYLRPWRAYASVGGRAIMCAHPEVNGVPMHASAWMQGDVWRGMFGAADSLIGSDYGDVNNIRIYGLAVSQTDAAIMGVTAGVDQELGASTYPLLLAAAQTGQINISIIDRAVSNVLRGKFATGLFDGQSQVNISALPSILDAPAHRAIAYNVAAEGTVLLQNNGVLPLAVGKTVNHIALIGPNAGCVGGDSVNMCDAQYNQCGGYTNYGARVVTIEDAIAAASGTAGFTYSFNRGCNIDDDNTTMVDAAVAAASAADVAIVVLGDSLNSCGEGIDVDELDWNYGQMFLLWSLITRSTTPVVLVAIHGRPFTFGAGPLAFTGQYNAIMANISAIVAAWRPGEEGGNAVWDILTGVVNPSGRLAQAWPRTAGAIRGPASPWFQQYSGAFSDYADETSGPLFPFGFGLSYSIQNITAVAVAPTGPYTPGQMITVSATVNNSGPAGAVVVQVYYTQNPPTKFVRYTLALLCYNKVVLPANTPATIVTIPCAVKDMEWYDTNVGDYVVYSGSYSLYVGLNSAAAGSVTPITFNVTGGAAM